MGLMAQIIEDAAGFISDIDGFAVPILFTTPGGTISQNINGVAINHSTTVNDFGAPIRGKTARVTISENLLNATEYPVRNTDNTIALKDHLVSWTDSAGLFYYGIITEILPDRSLGLVRCIVSDYKTGAGPRRIVAYKPARIFANLVDTPDPDQTQTLDNGDVIPLQYALNDDKTLTVPYCIGISVLSPFLIDNGVIQDIAFNKTTGTFDNSSHGGLFVTQNTVINAAIPIYQV